MNSFPTENDLPVDILDMALIGFTVNVILYILHRMSP